MSGVGPEYCPFAVERLRRSEIMDARRHAARFSGTKASDRVAGKDQRLKFGGAILALVVLLILAVHSPQIDSNAAPPTAAQSDGRAGVTFVSDYFPAQFGSPYPNGVPEEHIQAF
jgi:hypothetical protein